MAYLSRNLDVVRAEWLAGVRAWAVMTPAEHQHVWALHSSHPLAVAAGTFIVDEHEAYHRALASVS
jgi:hypothetical protein